MESGKALPMFWKKLDPPYSGDSPTLKMVVARLSQMSVKTYQTTRLHIQTTVTLIGLQMFLAFH
jgi:hypothetical protein